ncbi:pyrroline-5-carboxylate reductase [Lachnospiraceae bacterium A10]|nr:pyrroline-5-carboxylate reductase [Lachnospiraceae bacterium A10]
MGYKIGFIGCGNMGRAILGGLLKAGIVKADEVIISCHTKKSCSEVEAEYHVKAVLDNQEVAGNADVVLLAVKPNKFEEVMPDVKAGLERNAAGENTIVISIAAGKDLAYLEKNLGKNQKIIRVMPNTPALVGEGMSALTVNAKVTEEDLKYALTIFESFGKAEVVPESMMDAVIGVSGSSPAYVYMFIEALADGAVAAGMPRKQAYTFAAQSVLGAAKMILETGQHPGALKDAVCSPGGTTMAGVLELEKQGLRNAVIAGEMACIQKSIDMTKCD